MSENGFSPVVNVQNRFAHVDALRAFAVLVVVFAHAGLGSIVPGGSGVTIFFCISGFVITFIVLKESHKTGKFDILRFYRNRALKILPPLFLAIVVPSLIWSIWNYIDWQAFSGQVFFYYNWVKVGGGADVLPGTGVVWSLSIEEQFYLVFAAVWLCVVRAKCRVAWLAVLALLCIIYSTISRFVLYLGNAEESRIYYGSDTRLDGIAYGILLGIAYHRWLSQGAKSTKGIARLGGPWTLVLAVTVYLLSLAIRDEFFRETMRYSFQSLSACAVLAYGLVPGTGTLRSLFNRISGARLITAIGLSSYSIYLCHLVIGSAIMERLASWPIALKGGLGIFLGLTVGYLMYISIELPVQQWKSRRDRDAQRPTANPLIS